MKNLVFLYRLLYAAVLLIVVANLAKSVHFQAGQSYTENLLLVVGSVVGLALVVLLLIFPRSGTAALSLAIIGWLVLFSWFAWWSSASPFRLHESHSFDSLQYAMELHRHDLIAGAVFGLLCVWFASLLFVSRYRHPTNDARLNR